MTSDLGVQDIAVLLARATYTPIPYFLSLPIRELADWCERVGKLLERRPRSDGKR